MPELAGQSVQETLARLVEGKGGDTAPAKRQANKENRKGLQNDNQDREAAAKRAQKAGLEVLKEAYLPSNA